MATAHKPWSKEKQARQHKIVKRLFERPEPFKGQYLLPLRCGEEVTLQGDVELRVLRGSAEVLGAELRPSLNFDRIVVPPYVAAPRLRACGKGRAGRAGASLAEAPDACEFLAERKWSTVLCLRGLPSIWDTKALLRPREDRPRIKTHSTWPVLAEKFCKAAQALPKGAPPVLLVMGAKGMGKSTCCKFLVNRLLARGGDVFYLETDLGQPELGPSGSVSLHRIQRPMLQVAHAAQHLHCCEARFFVGGITPTIEPLLYAKCVRAAFQAYLDMAHPSGQLPYLVVNTMGWVQGFGMELVRSVIDITGPQLVLRLGKDKADLQNWRHKRSWDDTQTWVQEPKKNKRTRLTRCGPLAVSLGEIAGGAEAKSSMVFVDLPSLVDDWAVFDCHRPSALEQRWLRFTHYFCPRLNACEKIDHVLPKELFAEMPRRRLPLSRLRFGLIHAKLPASEIDVALTGTIVAFCCTGAGGADTAEPLPKLALSTSEPARTLALAYVHSFDWARGELTFFSPASEDELAKVDTVLRGDLIWDPHAIATKLPAGDMGMSLVSPLTPYCAAWSLDGLSSGTRAAAVEKSEGKTKDYKTLYRVQRQLSRQDASVARS